MYAHGVNLRIQSHNQPLKLQVLATAQYISLQYDVSDIYYYNLTIEEHREYLYV